MILSGKEIEREIKNGNIKIEPFDRSKINPNSYNLTLSDELVVYENKTRGLSQINMFLCWKGVLLLVDWGYRYMSLRGLVILGLMDIGL